MSLNDVRTPSARFVLRLFSLLLAGVFALGVSGYGPPASKFRPAVEGIARDYIVVLDVPPSDVGRVAVDLASRYGGSVKETWTLALRGFRADMPEEAARAMSADSRVRYVEQNVWMYRSGQQDTNDPPRDGKGAISGSYGEVLNPHPLWHLSRLSHRSREESEVERTYEYAPGSTGSGVRIYVVDSGVLRFHQEYTNDLVGAGDAGDHDEPAKHERVVEARGSNKTNADPLPSSVPSDTCDAGTIELTDVEGPVSDGPLLEYHENVWFDLANQSHGTSVAGIAAGRNTGVAKKAWIVPVKVMQCDKRESAVYFVRAFDWILKKVMLNPAPSVVTMSTYRTLVGCQSWEGTRCPDQMTARKIVVGTDAALQAFEESVQSVLDHGIPVVASANNNARDACHDTPARLSWSGGFGRVERPNRSGVITVGGLAKAADQRYVMDSTEFFDASNWGACVDLWAPAEKIASPLTSGWDAYRSSDFTGTSFSAPMVAGLIARMFDEDEVLEQTFRNPETRASVPGLVWGRLRDAAEPLPAGALLPTDEGRGSIQASSRRMAYMGAFTLDQQPKRFVVLSETKETLSAIPVGAPATATQWYRVDGQTSTPVSSSPTLCIQRNADGCEAPAVNTQYWARVTRTEQEMIGNELVDVHYTTDSARATVIADTPVITQQPRHRWIASGTTTTLEVVVAVPSGVEPPTYQWYRYPGTVLTSASARTAALAIPAEPSPADSLDLSAGYFVVVKRGEQVIETSDVAFVRVQSACPASRTIEHARLPLMGDVRPGEKITLTLKDVNASMEVRWYSGAAGDTSQPIKPEPYEQSDSIQLPGGVYAHVWALVYKGDCVDGQTGTIDLSDIKECDLGFPPPPAGQRFRASVRNGFTPKSALRLLSVESSSSVAYDWYRETKDASGQTILDRAHELPNLPDVLIQAPATKDQAIAYRALARKWPCSLLSDSMNVVAADCSPALDPSSPDSITQARTIRVFPGTTVAFPFARAVDSYQWILGSSEFGTRVDGICEAPCTVATRVATSQEFIRLEATTKFCGFAPQPSYEHSALIFLDVVPCPDPQQAPVPNFDISVNPLRPVVGVPFTLRAPAGVSASYRWFSGFYPNGTRLPESPVQGSPDSSIEIAGITESTPYYVVVEHDGCSGQTVTAVSRSLVVDVCRSPTRRRVSRSCDDCSVNPGTGVLLSVVDDHDGTTFAWYEGTDYADTSKPAGIGASIVVYPQQTTTYWVRATSPCGASATDSDFYVVDVSCDIIIVTPPESTAVKAPEQLPNDASVSVSVGAIGSGDLTHTWFLAGTTTSIGTGPTFTWTETITSTAPVYKDVYVTISRGGCTVQSADVRLAILPNTPQKIIAYTTGATIYSPQYPEILRVTMDPAPTADDTHSYTYDWYRDNGTPAGQRLTFDTPERDLYVSTDSIDTYWVEVTGRHRYGPGANDFYYDKTLSKRMYVSLYGTCELPALKVMQSEVSLDVGEADPIVFTASCDWPRVEFQWYIGQSGDTRDPKSADLGKPYQLTVDTGAVRSYWVRATLDCGAVVDSPTLTFTRGTCAPMLINQDIESVDVAYGDSATLRADPIVIDRPSYIWYQNEGQETVVSDSDGVPWTLKLENVTKSGRYWMHVRNLDCSNGADSYIATVRVAAHPLLTPPAWQTEVWTDLGTAATLDATTANAVSYQWYAGEVGDERPGTRIDGATSAILVTPALNAEAKYWVRIFAADGGSIDSPTITVKMCERAQILNTSPPNVSLLPYQSTYLDITAAGTGLTYQWYEGGTPGLPLTGNPKGRPIDRLRISPTKTTTYWVAVSSHCGIGGTDATMVHAAFTASVCPTVETTTAAHSTVMPGATTTVSVEADGYQLTYQWYVGSPGNKSNPISGATAATVPTPAIQGTTSFWCEVKSGNCARNSEAVIVGLCTEPEVRWLTGNKSVARNEVVDFIIDTDYTDTEPMVTVYKGPAGDVAASTVIVPAGPIYHFTHTFTETTSLWARAAIDNCYADTGNVTVTVCIPKITAQPVPKSIVAPQSATLTVGTDIPAAGYQWYEGEAGDTSKQVSGGTSASVTVSPAATTKYWVRVLGCGSSKADSTAAQVTVCTPADVTAHSPSQWLTKGSTRELWVDATGSGLTYRWYRGALGNTSNQIGNSFSVFVTPSDTTTYWARVSNGCGSDDTAAIVVSVCDTPAIATQPANQKIFSGSTATLRVVATQSTSTPMTYQWYRGAGTSSPIAGATSAEYVTPALTADTSYWVRITAGTCNVDSQIANVTMCAYPATLNAPADRDIAVGETVRLTATISPVPQQYRWYRGVQGDTSNQIGWLSYVDVAPNVTTSYWAEFTHDGCTMRSRTVTVWVSIPTITLQPVSKQVYPNVSTTLTVAANTVGVTYQWYRGTAGAGTLLTGETGTTLVVPAKPAGFVESYWVKVTGSRGAAVNSNTATVTWCTPASIAQHPQSYSIRRGTSATIAVSASGTNLRYQWYRGASPNESSAVGGATSSTYQVVQPQDTVSHWVKVTSDCGVANSTTSTIQVCVDPVINTQPGNPVINKGSTATLTVVATSGTSVPLSYQWYTGTSGSGTAISGETNASYTTPALTAAASYWVKVTSGACSINSNTATVSICPYPATTNQPADKYVKRGVATLLKVSLNPTPETYKWYRGAQGNRSFPLSTQPLFNVYPTVTTQYWGEFTYAGCVTWSRTMTINVCVPTITQQPQPQTIQDGATATLSVTATEAQTYQWYRDTYPSLIPGATNPTYTTPSLYQSEQYWVEITGSCGIMTRSNYIDVTVQ